MKTRASILAAALSLCCAQPAVAAGECAPANLSKLAEWEGTWAVEGIDAVAQGLSGRSGQADYKLIGLGAPWNEQGWARMAAMLPEAGSGKVKQGGWGFPMMMDSFSEFTFVVSPNRTAIINQYREIRTIYTDGRGHPPEDELWATNWGDSVGCWEGDTLVVDTVGVRFDPVFNIAAPPLSESAHFVERLRMVAPGRLQNEMTITDQVYLERPWTVRLDYIPAGLDRLVLDAYDDRNDTENGSIKPSTRKEFVAPALPKGVPLTPAQLAAVEGTYVLDGMPIEVAFVRNGDRLAFRPPGLDGSIPTIATGPLEFLSLTGERFRFLTDAEGKVMGLSSDGPRGPTTAKRKAP